MKNILLILIALPMIGFGQTLIPDANFEQRLISLGYDNILDGSVTTSSINTVTYLNVGSENISNLTGIEDFISLNVLYCENNQLTTLDLSNNTALTELYCSDNVLTSIDAGTSTTLWMLDCDFNQLTTLDVSNNLALGYLNCNNNQLTSLDVSNNIALTELWCVNNQLTSLDVSNNDSLTKLHCGDDLYYTQGGVVINSQHLM